MPKQQRQWVWEADWFGENWEVFIFQALEIISASAFELIPLCPQQGEKKLCFSMLFSF
jgi:hypothetical protein